MKVVDKATIDTVRCGADGEEGAAAAFKEACRVLAPGGSLVSVSHSSRGAAVRALGLPWDVREQRGQRSSLGDRRGAAPRPRPPARAPLCAPLCTLPPRSHGVCAGGAPARRITRRRPARRALDGAGLGLGDRGGRGWRGAGCRGARGARSPRADARKCAAGWRPGDGDAGRRREQGRCGGGGGRGDMLGVRVHARWNRSGRGDWWGLGGGGGGGECGALCGVRAFGGDHGRDAV
ncbi:hypothetical protein T484DRAFT_3476080 [Baffinella frigidus]|nr:hypothetical protein T484DRAFT_3476080 [Cryptophyta sp. CCMP2293]